MNEAISLAAAETIYRPKADDSGLLPFFAASPFAQINGLLSQGRPAPKAFGAGPLGQWGYQARLAQASLAFFACASFQRRRRFDRRMFATHVEPTEPIKKSPNNVLPVAKEVLAFGIG